MRADQDLSDKMADMEPEMRQLLMWDISSLVRWDIARYFIENDFPAATLDEIAHATGRDTEELLAATGALVASGWLSRRTVEGETTYTLTQERERRVRLNELHSALQEHDFRLKALYHWLRPRDG